MTAPADDARRGVWVDGSTGEMHEDRPADDAPRESASAEAMREAWAYAIVNAQGKRTGVIHADRSRLVPIVEADNDDDLAGGPFRIVPLAPLPARDDAVVEAARELADAADAAVAECGLNRTLDALDAAVRAYRAALRGTRPEGNGGGK